MKKILMIAMLLIISACAGKESLYTEEQQQILKEKGVLEIAENNCANPDSIQLMLDDESFDERFVQDYCRLPLSTAKHVNFLLEKQASDEDVLGFSALSYFREENYERYLKAEGNYEEKVLHVNLDLDLEPFEMTRIVENFSPDQLLVNKFFALPTDYAPDDLEEVKYACINGVDHGCTTMNKKMLRHDANVAFEKLVEAAKKEIGIDIVAIGTYRTVEYQYSLYHYYLPIYGLEKTDMYYARPGQSEHNSGFAVDITFDHIRYTEIQNYTEPYQWILENMHKYGFVLRYPEDKQDLTRYGYESWHLRYMGIEAATEIYENNWCVEEYFARKG